MKKKSSDHEAESLWRKQLPRTSVSSPAVSAIPAIVASNCPPTMTTPFSIVCNFLLFFAVLITVLFILINFLQRGKPMDRFQPNTEQIKNFPGKSFFYTFIFFNRFLFAFDNFQFRNIII